MQQNLIFDADDTLWENNIYFEDAFEQFCDYLAHTSMSPQQVRQVLDEIEIVNAKVYGYGSRNFARNLAACFQHLVERDVSQRDLEVVMDFAHHILEKPIELIDGVEETVALLSTRHELTLFTKGDPEEQRLKIDRSGLGRYFQHTAIVKEKNETAYRRACDGTRIRAGANLDDRQFAQVGYQPGASRWPERGVCSACANLEPGA